jgi:recombination protein RecA
MYNEGISRVGDVLDIAVDTEAVEKRGSFYSYGETRLGQGRENVKAFLRDNPDMALEIENQIREAKNLPILEVQVEDEQVTKEADV